MVKISDKTNYSRFARPSDDDEGIWLDYVEVHLVTHPVGQVKEMHVQTRRRTTSSPSAPGECAGQSMERRSTPGRGT